MRRPTLQLTSGIGRGSLGPQYPRNRTQQMTVSMVSFVSISTSATEAPDEN